VYECIHIHNPQFTHRPAHMIQLQLQIQPSKGLGVRDRYIIKTKDSADQVTFFSDSSDTFAEMEHTPERIVC